MNNSQQQNTVAPLEATPQTRTVVEDEIDLIALAKTLWVGRMTVIYSGILFGLLGIVVALCSAEVYTASTTVVPQESDPKAGGMSGLAAMAGINLNMGGGETLSPMIYPQVVGSLPFHKELMETELSFLELSQPVTVFQYYTEEVKPNPVVKYTVGLPGLLIGALRSEEEVASLPSTNNIPSLSEDEKKVRETLSELVSVEYNDKDGYVTLTANAPEALAAAQLAQKSITLLQEYITSFKIEKAKGKLDYVQESYSTAKNKFEAIQDELALFRDRNRNVVTNVARTEEERLTSEYNIAFTVYSELAKQLEQAKLQVKEDTPVFTVVEPVSVPTERSKPKRALLVIVFGFLGGIVGIGIVFGKSILAQVKEQWEAV